jgi:hypothetical protein
MLADAWTRDSSEDVANGDALCDSALYSWRSCLLAGIRRMFSRRTSHQCIAIPKGLLST